LTVIPLLQRRRGANSRKSTYQDTLLQTGGIAVDQDAYTSGLDRIYDVKGLQNMHIEIENTGANSLDFRIELAKKEFSDISTLVDADFGSVLIPDTAVGAASKTSNNIVEISPESTALRIRVRRTSAGQDAELKGIVSTN